MQRLMVVFIFAIVILAISCNRPTSCKHTETLEKHGRTRVQNDNAPREPCPAYDKGGGTVSPLDQVQWPSQSFDNPGTGLLGAIYKHQNPEDCKNAKYIIWRFPLSKRDARNIGALYSTIQVWLAYAMQFDRILVLDDRNWKLTDSRCEHRSSTCYFRPISACSAPYNPKSIVSLRKADQVEMQPEDTEVIEFEGAWWPLHATHPFDVNVTLPSGKWTMKKAHAKPKVVTEWSTAALQYMWRPNDGLERKINKVLGQLKLSEQIIPDKTIAMPVRASDKCRGHSIAHSANGEEVCITLDLYMKAAEKVRQKDPNVDTIILTSESRRMVEDSRKYGEDGRWRFVYNTVDVMQGTGSTNEKTLEKSTSRSKGIESALTSLHIQLRARYFVLPYQPNGGRPYSSWLLSIGHLSQSSDLTFTDKNKPILDVRTETWYEHPYDVKIR